MAGFIDPSWLNMQMNGCVCRRDVPYLACMCTFPFSFFFHEYQYIHQAWPKHYFRDRHCRIGRSGRFGRKGVAINFVTNDDIHTLRDIEQYYSTQIDEMPMNGAWLIYLDRIRVDMEAPCSFEPVSL